MRQSLRGIRHRELPRVRIGPQHAHRQARRVGVVLRLALVAELLRPRKQTEARQASARRRARCRQPFRRRPRVRSDRSFRQAAVEPAGWLSSASRSTGVPGLMKDTPPSTVCPLGDGCPVRGVASRRVAAAALSVAAPLRVEQSARKHGQRDESNESEKEFFHRNGRIISDNSAPLTRLLRRGLHRIFLGGRRPRPARTQRFRRLVRLTEPVGQRRFDLVAVRDVDDVRDLTRDAATVLRT